MQKYTVSWKTWKTIGKPYFSESGQMRKREGAIQKTVENHLFSLGSGVLNKKKTNVFSTVHRSSGLIFRHAICAINPTFPGRVLRLPEYLLSQ